MVFPDASHELHRNVPSPQGQSAIRTYTAAMQLKPFRQTFLTGLRPGFHATDDVRVYVA